VQDFTSCVLHLEDAMMTHQSNSILAVVLAMTISSAAACALRTPSIAELKYNPGRYYDKTVTVSGVVTSAWGIPLLPVRGYKIDDGSGEILVLSQGSRGLPTKGARVRVRGKVNELAVFGGQSYGLHIREHDVDFRRGRN
jgi:hypothetical protein